MLAVQGNTSFFANCFQSCSWETTLCVVQSPLTYPSPRLPSEHTSEAHVLQSPNRDFLPPPYSLARSGSGANPYGALLHAKLKTSTGKSTCVAHTIVCVVLSFSSDMAQCF